MPRKKSSVKTIYDIEKQVFELENVRIVIRLPDYLAAGNNNGEGYNYKRGLGDKRTIAHLWFRLRRIFGQTVPFVVVQGDGKVIEATHGGNRLGILLSTVRDTYN